MKNTDNSPQQSLTDLAADQNKDSNRGFERISEKLYRKGTVIYARVRLSNGKPTWRSTSTSDLRDARKWLKKWEAEAWMKKTGITPASIALSRAELTVDKLIDRYIDADFPTRKMQAKRATTIKNEQACIKVIRQYFGSRKAATLTLADCDAYKDWRIGGGRFEAAGEKESRRKRLKKGKRSVDLELTVLCNVLHLAVRQEWLERNPISRRTRYTLASDVRPCRAVAPSPSGLRQIERWLRQRNEHGTADFLLFLAFSGLRIGEALPLGWRAVDWAQGIIHVRREKEGIYPWVPVLSEMAELLRKMQTRANGDLLFPSPFESRKPRNDSAVRHRITAACRALALPHVTPHGLRSYFVTRARESGVTDEVIAKLIGDRTGPAIIASTYGDVLPEHLHKEAKRIRLAGAEGDSTDSNTKATVSLNVSECISAIHAQTKTLELSLIQRLQRN